MFRILVALIALTTGAIAAPEYLEQRDGETLKACVHNLSDEQQEKLGSYLARSLANRNYAQLTHFAKQSGEYSNGDHTVFVNVKDKSICIQYIDPNQPKLPVMHGEEFFYSIEFCPVPDAPFKITWDEIEVVIDRFEDKAHCIWRSGDSYECTEERQTDGGDNHYFVKARVAKQGQVLIFTPPGDEPQQFISRCDAF